MADGQKTPAMLVHEIRRRGYLSVLERVERQTRVPRQVLLGRDPDHVEQRRKLWTALYRAHPDTVLREVAAMVGYSVPVVHNGIRIYEETHTS